MVAIKVASGKVDGMVSPRPLFEIYVHSRKLEGIHLRGGMVARGGLRWSDRHDDFRTEILGLMKTQQLKNAIIVPVGSKGGFVLKGQLPPRPALDTYLIERYREFVSGLLDVTDNLVAGRGRAPARRGPPRRRRCLPRRRRRQGHGASLRHRQLGVGAIRLLARRRLRLGRQQRLRPQARGDHGARRLGVRPPPLPQPRASTCRRSRSPASASATWRATCSATACCAARRRGSSRRSTTSTCSSTRRPTPRRASPSARACSRCRARRGRTTTRRRSAKAAASSSAPPRKCRSARRRARCSASRTRRRAARRWCARSSPRRSTCSTTAASAPTSRRRPRRTPTSAIARTIASASTPRRSGPASSAKAATSA